MERDGKPEASEEARERDRDLNSHQVLMAGRPIPAVATGWNKWAIILDWPESPVGWGWGCRRKLRGCWCPGLFSIWKLLISSGPASWGASPGSSCH